MEVGGGGYGGGEGGVSGCWRTQWLPGKFSRMPPTGKSEVGLNLSVSNSFSLNCTSYSVKSSWPPLQPPNPPPSPSHHAPPTCLCLIRPLSQFAAMWQQLSCLITVRGFHVWAGVTRTSLSSAIQERFVQCCVIIKILLVPPLTADTDESLWRSVYLGLILTHVTFDYY